MGSRDRPHVGGFPVKSNFAQTGRKKIALKPYKQGLTDKDDEGAVHLYPLTDYKPRGGESLIRSYMAGRYGAVPFIPKGLLGSFVPDDQAEKGEAH